MIYTTKKIQDVTCNVLAEHDLLMSCYRYHFQSNQINHKFWRNVTQKPS